MTVDFGNAPQGSTTEKEAFLSRYWKISECQIETSVALLNDKFQSAAAEKEWEEAGTASSHLY